MKGLLDRWDAIAALWLVAVVALVREISAWLPEMVPTHWNHLGHIDGWTPRGQLVWFVTGVPVFVWVVTVGLDAVARRTAKGKDEPVVGLGPLRFGLVSGISLFSLSVCMTPLLGNKSMLGPLLAMFGCLAFGFWHLRQRYKLAMANLPDAAHWKYGLFYHNPADQRVWVDKRFGYGWTLNFARPIAKVILAVAVAPPLVLVVVLASLAR